MKHKIIKQIPSVIKLFVGCFILAISVNLLLIPNELVTGGMTGVSIVLHNLFGITPGIFILISSAVLVVMSFFTLGKERASRMAVGALLWPILLNITGPFIHGTSVAREDLLLIALFAGITTGVAAGLINKAGFSTGGGEAITLTVSKWFNISYGKAARFVDGSIILTGGLVFGPTKVLYALVIMYLASRVADKIILGISDNKVFYITTTKTKAVRRYIEEELGYDVTILDVESSILKKQKNVLISAVETNDYFRMKEGIKEIDKKSYIMIIDEFEHLERKGKTKHEQKIKCIKEEGEQYVNI